MKRLWQVGVFHGAEPVYFGPLSKEKAEELFKKLSADPIDGATAFIQPMPKKRRSRLPW